MAYVMSFEHEVTFRRTVCDKWKKGARGKPCLRFVHSPACSDDTEHVTSHDVSPGHTGGWECRLFGKARGQVDRFP